MRRWGFAIIVLASLCQPAQAAVLHSVLVTSPDGPTFDFLDVPTPDDVDRTVFASESSSSGYSVSAAIGPFGNLGTEGVTMVAGPLSAEVDIRADFANLGPNPLRAVANFVIDGGEFVLVGSPGSTLTYSLTLRRSNDLVFESQGILEGVSFFETAFEASGADIGASFDGDATVTLPTSFQSVDLGIIGPGEPFSLSYFLEIEATVDSFGAELIRWEFSDPLSVEGAGEFPIETVVSFLPVPEPSALGMLVLAAAGSALAASRRASLRG